MYSLVLWIVVSGLVLKFSNLRIPDFSHASLYMLAAYITYSIVRLLPDEPVSFIFAIIVSFFSLMLVGGILEVVLLRRIYKSVHILQALLTFSLILVFADVVRAIWGLTPKLMPKPSFLSGSFNVGKYSFPTQYILITIVAVLVGIGLWYLLKKTKTGSIIRALTDDPETAACMGINVPRWTTGVFMLGCGLAGLGGSIITLQSALGPGMDLAVLLNLFIVLVIGGMGSLAGSLISVLILGQVNALGVVFFPQLAMVLPFILMAVVLIVRPYGLLGKKI